MPYKFKFGAHMEHIIKIRDETLVEDLYSEYSEFSFIS
jgi:hypothetical protein